MFRRDVLAITALVWVVAMQFVAGDMSPSTWPAEQLQEYVKLNTQHCYPACPHPLAVAPRGGVVAGSTNILASLAGVKALENGGNAWDAIAAAASAQVVLATGAYVSFAGIMRAVCYDAAGNETWHLDGGWRALLEQDPTAIPAPGTATKANAGAGVMTPGFVAALTEGQKRVGKLTLAEVLAPATYWARNGFELGQNLPFLMAAALKPGGALDSPEGRAIFVNPETGKPYAAGEVIKQPDMADFLDNVSAVGADYMYAEDPNVGRWGAQWVDTLRSAGGNATAGDLTRYATTWEPAVRSPWAGGGASVAVPGPEGGWGGVSTIEQASLMDISGVSQAIQAAGAGASLGTNATALYWAIQFVRWSTSVSSFTHAVPNGAGPGILQQKFGLNLTDASRLTRSTAQGVWRLLSAPGGVARANAVFCQFSGASNCTEPLDEVDAYGSAAGQSADAPDVEAIAAALRASEDAIKHSNSLVAADGDGNVCSIVHTANAEPWGSGLFVQGNALPNAASIFRAFVATASRGGRVGTDQVPIIAFDGATGGPVAALAVVGSGLASTTLQTLSGLLDAKQDAATAADAPVFYNSCASPCDGSGQGYKWSQAVLQGAFDESVVDGVRALGQHIDEVSEQTAHIDMGMPSIVTLSPSSKQQACSSTPWGNGGGAALPLKHA